MLSVVVGEPVCQRLVARSGTAAHCPLCWMDASTGAPHMTEQEIGAVFDELRRIGVDLERPPGLALGTGFRPDAFLPWLRDLPDALGHDAFVERLDAHVAAAAPIDQAENPAATEPGRRGSERWVPTREQLEAAIDVLTEEWDPLGARLGDLSRDDVADYAFDALLGVLSPGGRDTERWVAKMLCSVEQHVFGVRPSPAAQRRYLARRLMQVAKQHPTAVHDDPWVALEGGNGSASSGTPTRKQTTSNRVELGPRGDEPPALDPHAVCSRCGAVGTVAFVTRDVEPLVSRYCADCWRHVRGNRRLWPPDVDKESAAGKIAIFDYMEEMMGDPWRSSGSALWDDAVELIRKVLASPDDGSERGTASNAYLAAVAREYVEHAPEMYGPMPPEIEAFVRQHASPAT
jgi:hypothetical protein